MKQSLKPWLYGGAFIVATIAALLLALGLSWQYFLQKPLKHIPEHGVVFHLKPGSSSQNVSKKLATQGLLTHPWYFRALIKLSGQSRRLQAGEYLITAGTTPSQLLNQFVLGQVRQHPFVIIEGQTFAEIKKTLAKLDNIEHKLATLDLATLTEQLSVKHQSLEGYLFPETYHYVQGSSDLELLQRASKRLQQVLAQAWQHKQEKLPYQSPYQALIMASIIEKETAIASERPRVARVLINRLDKNMRLQADPTVIYGLGDAYQGDIRRRHLKKETPYNTYFHKGLPPTPIAMPGFSAIEAALQPASGNELYFVADGQGRHVFSENLTAHNKAVQRFINMRQSNTPLD